MRAIARRRRLLATCFGLALVTGACRSAPKAVSPTADPTSQRTLVSGAVVGATGLYGEHVWRGIPYAAPPVGSRRWRAAAAPEAWSGTRPALATAPYCAQLPSVFGGVESSDDRPVGQEDCLYLNVFAPRFAPDAVPRAGARLPVMVWIHGGGNVVGHAGRYEGGNLAVAEQVVVVTLNYRLGPLGWFRHASLRDEAVDDDDRSGNFGLLDMVRALAWARENVSAFGGDPANVTIFGESAGGRDVFALLLSPRAHGLFHRAVVQSGGTHTLPVAEAEAFADAAAPGRHNSSNEILLRVLRRDTPGRSRAAAKQALAAMAPAAVAARLRALSAAELLGHYRRESQEGLIDVPQMFRDGVVLPAGDPIEAVRAGIYNQVPTVFGTNKDETKLFMALNPGFTWRLFGRIPIVRDPEHYEATARHLSLHWKARGADQPATAMRAVQGPTVWVYRFDWDEEPTVLTVNVSRLLGAAHGVEIPFVFGHWDLGRQTNILFSAADEPGRVALSKQMMAYWGALARSGDPNGAPASGLPRWEPFAIPDGRFLVLDTEAGGGIRMTSGTITPREALARVERDTTLATPAAKCAVYQRFVEWEHEPSRAEYPGLVAGACAQFPLPSVPLS